MSEWIDVAPVAEFLPGTFRRLEIDGVAGAVFNVDGHYYAIEDLCTHEAETLSGGELVGLSITCPRHAAVFSLLTGEALEPPAYLPIAIFPTRVHDGMVQVAGRSLA